jgi:hypothetical protein
MSGATGGYLCCTGMGRRYVFAMKKMPPLTLLGCLVVLICGIALSSAYAGDTSPLDGMKFEGSLTEEGSAKAPIEETLTFENGEFTSEACIRYGFGTAPYKVTREGDKITWSAVVSSSESNGGKAEWSGTVVGGKLTGRMIWTKPDETIDYVVEAETPR